METLYLETIEVRRAVCIPLYFGLCLQNAELTQVSNSIEGGDPSQLLVVTDSSPISKIETSFIKAGDVCRGLSRGHRRCPGVDAVTVVRRSLLGDLPYVEIISIKCLGHGPFNVY
ncbi:hypothetical protein L1987_00429 [Smallanthus sonchifolius]|uniref:Uncharacterized protein n=1 Tax=Smallanthus sonchifolius TaxID=185202 RepID=A0ACB9K230_9ASTR|nr:hypothetical protein L1987_00429 [Smallanthus sonchifolius]